MKTQPVTKKELLDLVESYTDLMDSAATLNATLSYPNLTAIQVAAFSFMQTAAKNPDQAEAYLELCCQAQNKLIESGIDVRVFSVNLITQEFIGNL